MRSLNINNYRAYARGRSRSKWRSRSRRRETRRSTGLVRDAIIDTFKATKKELTVAEVRDAVNERLGENIPSSSVRSYLRLNTPGRFTRTGRGTYRFTGR